MYAGLRTVNDNRSLPNCNTSKGEQGMIRTGKGCAILYNLTPNSMTSCLRTSLLHPRVPDQHQGRHSTHTRKFEDYSPPNRYLFYHETNSISFQHKSLRLQLCSATRSYLVFGVNRRDRRSRSALLKCLFRLSLLSNLTIL
jgi:hypothetical protein